MQKQVTLYILTRHDDMKDARFPLFSHSVGGAAEECSIVHGVVRCVSQSALATFTRCSHVGNSENNIKKITIFLWIEAAWLSMQVVPFAFHFDLCPSLPLSYNLY